MSLVGVGKLIVAIMLELPRCDGGGIGGGLVSGCLLVCAPGVGVFLWRFFGDIRLKRPCL